MARGECPVCLERYDADKHAPMVSVACGHSVCADCAVALLPARRRSSPRLSDAENTELARPSHQRARGSPDNGDDVFADVDDIYNVVEVDDDDEDDDDEDDDYDDDDDDDDDDGYEGHDPAAAAHKHNDERRRHRGRRKRARCPSCNVPLSTFVKNFEALHALQSVAGAAAGGSETLLAQHGDDSLLRRADHHLASLHPPSPAGAAAAAAGASQQQQQQAASAQHNNHSVPDGASASQFPLGYTPHSDVMPVLQPSRPSLADVTDIDNVLDCQALKFTRAPSHELGAGSTGVVYRGTYQDKNVAIKCIRSATNSLTNKDNFRRELMLISRLRNPHIVDFVGAAWDDADDTSNGVDSGPPSLLLVTELMAGGTLRSALSSLPGKPLTCLEVRSFLNVATQIARGLVYLHAEGLAHRDIKSANILLSHKLLPDTNSFPPDVRAKIADFGLSKYIGKITGGAGYQQSIMEPGRLEATYAYLAPEAFGGDKTNVIKPTDDDDGRFQETAKKRDIYALGVLYWEMLTGLIPWAGTSLPDVYVRVCVRGDRPTPTLEETRVPKTLRRLVERCWVQEAKHRPSASSIVDKLERITMRLNSGKSAGNAPDNMSSVQLQDPHSAHGAANVSSMKRDSLPVDNISSDVHTRQVASRIGVHGAVQSGYGMENGNRLLTGGAPSMDGAMMPVPSRPSLEAQAGPSANDGPLMRSRDHAGTSHGVFGTSSTVDSDTKASNGNDGLLSSRIIDHGSQGRLRERKRSGRSRSSLRSFRETGPRAAENDRTDDSNSTGMFPTSSSYLTTREGDSSISRPGPSTRDTSASSNPSLVQGLPLSSSGVVVRNPSFRSADPTAVRNDVNNLVNGRSSPSPHKRRPEKDRGGRASDMFESARMSKVLLASKNFERSPSYGCPPTTSGALSPESGPVSLGARLVSVAGSPQIPVTRRMISVDGSHRVMDEASAPPDAGLAFSSEDERPIAVGKLTTEELLSLLSQRSKPPRLATLALKSLQSDKHNRNEEVLRNAAALLHRLTVPPGSAGPESKDVSAKEQIAIRKYLKSNGAVFALLHILKAPQLRHATTLCYALLAIGNLIAWDLDAHKQFRESDGVASVALCLRHFPDSMGIQEKGCYALACAAATYSSKTKSVFLHSSCIDLVVKALNQANVGSTHDAVIKQACAALAAMCLGSNENAARAGNLGALSLLLGAFESYRQGSRAEGGRHEMHLVCNAFLSLMCSPENRKNASSQGGSALILRAMRIFRLDAAFIEKSTIALCELCGTRGNASQVVQLNGVEDVIAAMLRFKTSIPIQHSCARTLSLLIRATGDNGRRRVVQAGGAEAIIFAMERFGSSSGGNSAVAVAVEGCAAIAVLSAMDSVTEGEILSKRLRKLRADRAVKQVMQAHKGNQVVQEKGKECLKVLHALRSGGGWFSRIRQRNKRQ